jgi:hypothetical protein
MKQSYKKSAVVSVGGIVAALSVVLMFMTAVIPSMTYALPAAAGVLLSVIVIEIDKKTAFGVYAVVSLLSVLLVGDKEAAVMYIMFFGYYPILKAVFESRLSVPVSWLCKLAVFNVGMVAAFLISVYVFNIPFEEMEKYGPIAAFAFLGVGNIIFFIYDFALSNLIKLYLLKWRKGFRRIFKF